MRPIWPLLLVALLAVPLGAVGGPTAGARSPSPSPGAAPASPAAQLAAAKASLTAPGGPEARATPPLCRGDPSWADGACRLARAAALRPAPASSGSGWVPAAGGAPPPQVDYSFALTYDAADGYVLLVGNSTAGTGDGPSPDAWAYAGGTWRSLDGTHPPVFCPGSSLAYDAVDGYVVLFAANASYYAADCPDGGQTWSYRAGTWTELHPTISPSPRWGAALTNDSAVGGLLLFGGESAKGCGPRGSYSYCGDTWNFSHGQWGRIPTTTAPSNRSNAGLADDLADGYVVLFGGEESFGGINDTWTFANGTWTDLNLTHAPPVPYPDGLSYDPVDHDLVYTNAWNWSGPPETTWTFAAGTWSAVTVPGGPEQRLGAEQAFDYADGYLVFFGGEGYTDLADTWSFVSGTWANLTRPVPSPYSTMTYDDLDGYVLLFGDGSSSTASNATWTFAHDRWTNLSLAHAPSARYREGMVTDDHDGYVLLFGGISAHDVALNDSWEFLGGRWTQLTPSRAPSPRGLFGMVYDGADGDVLLFGGTPTYYGQPWAGNGGFRDTWVFRAGSWNNLTANYSGAPPSSPANALVYDARDGYVLLFGEMSSAAPGLYASSLQAETWSFVGGVWTNLTASVAGAPPPTAMASVAYDSSDGAVILFGGASVGPAPGYAFTDVNTTWSYRGKNWTELFPAVAPPAADSLPVASDPPDGGVVLVDAAPGYRPPPPTTWVWTGGGVRPAIAGFSAAPNPVDVGAAVTLQVVAAEGSAVLSYAYVGLPTGCVSANRSSLRCVPAAVGNYTVTATVSDPYGNSTNASVVVQAVADPSVASFAAVPASVAVGNRTILSTNVTGGIAPYQYTYGGLPPGCSSQTVPALPCTPTTAGNYTVRVVANDSFGMTSSATLLLAVTGVGRPGGPAITSFAATPSAFVLGNSTNLSVAASGNGSLTFAYSGLPAGCASANASGLGCTPTVTGTFNVTVAVTASAGGSASTSTTFVVYPVRGGRNLSVSAFSPSVASPTVGEEITLTLTASGGSGTLSYSYQGLPIGCAALDLPTLTCTPLQEGSYTVLGHVQDASSDAVSVPLRLEVLPGTPSSPLAISRFVADPPTVAAGTPTTLEVTIAGGGPNLGYAYAGLPSGCSGADTPELECVTTSVGSYAVHVTVTDGDGERANATTTLVVVAAPPGAAGSHGGSVPPAELLGAVAALAAVVGSVGYALGRRRPAKPAPAHDPGEPPVG